MPENTSDKNNTKTISKSNDKVSDKEYSNSHNKTDNKYNVSESSNHNSSTSPKPSSTSKFNYSTKNTISYKFHNSNYITSFKDNFVIPENPVDEHSISDLCTDNEEFSDIFISKQKTERGAEGKTTNVNMDYSIKLDISKVIEEEESKLRESINV